MRRTIIPVVALALALVAALVVTRDEPADRPGDGRETQEPGTGTPLGDVVHVSAAGSDDNDGASPERALATIQKALDRVEPGATIHLAAGIYRQDFRTVRDGLADAPITVMGPPDAVVQGSGALSVVQVNHDHHVFRGFTIDGQFGDDEDDSRAYRQKLLYAQGRERGSGVTGLKVLDMTITNALDECIRLRYFAVDNEVAGNTISNCGLKDFEFGGGRKNGEGIYIGTAPEQTDDGNPTDEPDRSSGNRIHDNRISGGSECVDVKEGSTANVIESNTCTRALDSDSGGIDIRGSDNLVRGNTVIDGEGAGVRLGGDAFDDGTGNDVVGNVLRDNDGGAIKIMAAPQGEICGNTVSDSEVAVGDFAEESDSERAVEPCRGGVGA